MIKRINNENYIFIVTTLYYFLVWFINPGNKIIALSFLLLMAIFYYKLKDIRLSTLFTYLVSSIVFTGKKYMIELVPPGVFPLDIYPYGYVAFLVISPKHILAVIMFLFIVRDLFKKKLQPFQIELKEVILVSYFFWLIFSDLVISKRPEISLPFSILSLEVLILYFYIKFYFIKNNRYLSILIWLFASLIFFQSFISFQQLMGSSPVYKNLEAQVDIEYFGHAVDEPQFRFRPLGTFGHANEMGMWMSFALSLVLASFIKFPDRVFFGSFILGVIALIMSLSRSAWIGFTASVLALLYTLEKVKKIKITVPKIFTRNIAGIAIISISVFMFFVLPRVGKSLYSFGEGGGILRFLQVEESIRLILQNPLFGVGTAMSVQESLLFDPSGVFGQVPLAVHNWYLLITVEHGLPALTLFLLFMIISVKKTWLEVLKSKMNSLGDYLSVGIISGIISLFIIAIFQPFIGGGLILFSLGLLGSKERKANK